MNLASIPPGAPCSASLFFSPDAVERSDEGVGIDPQHPHELLVVEGGVDRRVGHTVLLHELVKGGGHRRIGRFDLDVEDHAGAAAEREELVYRRDADILEFGSGLDAGVEDAELVIGIIGDQSRERDRLCSKESVLSD